MRCSWAELAASSFRDWRTTRRASLPFTHSSCSHAVGRSSVWSMSACLGLTSSREQGSSLTASPQDDCLPVSPWWEGLLHLVRAPFSLASAGSRVPDGPQFYPKYAKSTRLCASTSFPLLPSPGCRDAFVKFSSPSRNSIKPRTPGPSLPFPLHHHTSHSLLSAFVLGPSSLSLISTNLKTS